MEVIDGEEVPDKDLSFPPVAHCVKHSPSFGCEASLPSCSREYYKGEEIFESAAAVRSHFEQVDIHVTRVEETV